MWSTLYNKARRLQSSKQSKRAGGKRGSRSSKSSTELLASDFVVASDGAFALPGTDTLIKERQAKSGAPPPGQSGVASLSGTVHVSRHLSSIRRSAQRQRLELQAYENVSPVVMALATEAEVDEPHGVRAAAVTQPISGSGPSVKESSQVAGVVAVPSTELSGKIGPEASNIANEVFPASSAVYEDIHKERSGLKVQGDLTKLGNKHLAVVVKGSTYPTTAPKKLIEKPSLVKSTNDDAHVSSKTVRQQKSRRSLEKLLSDKSSTRGIEKPADVTVPQVVADGDRMSKTGALEKQRGSITSKKSRMSVDEMLILNKQLPSDSDQGVLQSDVNVVVAVVPQPAAESEAVEEALMKEEPDGQQAKPELEEQQPLRGEMVAVGGPEQSAEVGRDSAGKNAKGGSSKHSKARRRRLKHLAKRQAVKKRKVAPLVPYKPTMALVSVESDSTYMRIPTTSGATIKQGKQGVPCAAQEELPELEEPRRKNVGQEDASSSSRRASKSSESVAKLAFAQHEAPVDAKVEDKPARAEGSGKKTSLSASYLRLREGSAAAKRPLSRPGTRTSLQEEDRGANKDAAMAGRDVLEPAVPEAERQGGMFEPIQRVPLRKEGSQANVAALIPDDKRQKESKRKSLRKGRKRHHKKTTG
ncbi:neurofilament heavy polypeptide-like [Rhipicephalus sanguineus]|uniref:neurofilament heavy polypeptide-like n=1 Tax=Rhipicephalus sanguineus TaxID=34632 RepID=UPI0020C54626|nr:neurofilament heavy polypeptide-like [Rhipicephalus sanguineus]